MTDKAPLESFDNPPGAITVLEPVAKDPMDQLINKLEEQAAATAEDYQKTLDVYETERTNILDSKVTADDLNMRNLLSPAPALPPGASNTELFLATVGIFALAYFLLKGKL